MSEHLGSPSILGTHEEIGASVPDSLRETLQGLAEMGKQALFVTLLNAHLDGRGKAANNLTILSYLGAFNRGKPSTELDNLLLTDM